MVIAAELRRLLTHNFNLSLQLPSVLEYASFILLPQLIIVIIIIIVVVIISGV